ncbi:hypothetical protein F7R21_00155 [Burkholderia latens]|uniref:Alpha/beta hydrolase n=1 Tax=Burkholderia latens TaxID=488446 RepID=A0A6H9T5X7_9BURK|nr:hypothetical protein F7R21_00155 [Burkholderia latens]
MSGLLDRYQHATHAAEYQTILVLVHGYGKRFFRRQANGSERLAQVQRRSLTSKATLPNLSVLQHL